MVEGTPDFKYTLGLRSSLESSETRRALLSPPESLSELFAVAQVVERPDGLSGEILFRRRAHESLARESEKGKHYQGSPGCNELRDSTVQEIEKAVLAESYVLGNALVFTLALDRLELLQRVQTTSQEELLLIVHYTAVHLISLLRSILQYEPRLTIELPASLALDKDVFREQLLSTVSPLAQVLDG